MERYVRVLNEAVMADFMVFVYILPERLRRTLRESRCAVML
jgi:hypothetical protein